MAIPVNETLKRYMAAELPAAELPDALLPVRADACELLVACDPDAYSASALARAVEDCDVQLLALAVTAMRDAAGRPVVMLRAATRNAAAIERSLARYGYETIFSRGELSDSERTEAQARVNELLRYLEM